ncbi:MAG: hypothetical protein U9P44_03735, partial [archaeon]|nr:hypothetical protein [archaeon]
MHDSTLFSAAFAMFFMLFFAVPSYAEVFSPITGQVTEDDSSIFLIDVTKEDALTITVSLYQPEALPSVPDDEITLVGIYDPSGKAMTDGNCSGSILKTCKIYNPTAGTWLVEVYGDKIYGTGEINVQASYIIKNFQVYYNTYEPDDYTSMRYDINQYSMQFFEKYISTSDKNHLAVISRWDDDDYSVKYDLSIISPNLKTAIDISIEDQTNAQAYYLTPGDEAEGKWIVLLRSIKGNSPVTIYTNYG